MTFSPLSFIWSLRPRFTSLVATAGLIAVALAGFATPTYATFPGYNGQLVVTRGHALYEGRTRSNILLSPDGTGLVDLTSLFAADGFLNTQVLFGAANGTGIVGVRGYVNLINQTWNPWPTLPLTMDFTFTPCPNQRVYFTSNGPLNDGRYLYSMKFDGTDLRQIAANVDARNISCAPDGSKIAMVLSPPSTGVFGGDLYLIGADGGNLTQLTTN